jgi:hypothetical protein
MRFYNIYSTYSAAHWGKKKYALTNAAFKTSFIAWKIWNSCIVPKPMGFRRRDCHDLWICRNWKRGLSGLKSQELNYVIRFLNLQIKLPAEVINSENHTEHSRYSKQRYSWKHYQVPRSKITHSEVRRFPQRYGCWYLKHVMAYAGSYQDPAG